MGGQRAQAKGLSVLTREAKHAKQGACQSNLWNGSWRWLGTESWGDTPADTTSWEPCLESLVPGKSMFCLPWAYLGCTERHSRATQSSFQSLRAGRPVVDAQGWKGLVSGRDAMTITHRTGSPVSLGPQQSTSPSNLHLWDGKCPCANLL